MLLSEHVWVCLGRLWWTERTTFRALETGRALVSAALSSCATKLATWVLMAGVILQFADCRSPPRIKRPGGASRFTTTDFQAVLSNVGPEDSFSNAKIFFQHRGWVRQRMEVIDLNDRFMSVHSLPTAARSSSYSASKRIGGMAVLGSRRNCGWL